MPDSTPANQEVEGQTTTAMPPETKPAEAVEPTLPNEASERTKAQFEKLQQHNKELAAKVAQLEGTQKPQVTSVLDELTPHAGDSNPQPEEPTEPTSSRFMDKEGYVDVGAVDRALKDANDRANRAAEAARRTEEKVARFEQTTEERRAHEKYPYLDPYNPDFDRKFYNLVRKELLDQSVTKGKMDLMAAAKEVKQEVYNPETTRSQEQTAEAEKTKQIQAKRTNAGATPGTGKQGITDAEQADLEKRTRKGDVDATYERLQASGY